MAYEIIRESASEYKIYVSFLLVLVLIGFVLTVGLNWRRKNGYNLTYKHGKYKVCQYSYICVTKYANL